jgi:membrane protein required for colicin V production
MNFTDVLILLGMAAYVVLGFRDGFLKKVFAILGLWGGLVIATKYMAPVGDQYTAWFGLVDETASILAFASLFLAVTLVVSLFFRWFGSTDTESLKITSRLAGSILGAAQGSVAISLLLLMFNVFDLPSVDSQNESLLYRQWIGIAPAVFDYSTQWLPESRAFFQEVEGKLQKLKGAH